MEIELETGNGEKKKLIRQDFAFSVISEFIEMLRQNFCIISSDKQLNKLFTELTDYLNSRLPDFDGDIVDYYVLIKPTG